VTASSGPIFCDSTSCRSLLGMEDAERRVSGRAREATTAAVGRFKRAAIGVRSFARRSFLWRVF